MILEKIKQTVLYKILKILKIIDIVLWMVNRINDVMRFIKHTRRGIYTHPRIQNLAFLLRIVKFLLSESKRKSIPKREKELIVSLSSYPSRFKTLHHTLLSLITQETVPDRIILWLIEGEHQLTQLPFFCRILTKYIDIEWGDINYRAFNKFIYSRRKYPEALIVVCDDDLKYQTWWLGALYEEHLKTPDQIVGCRGNILFKKSKNELISHQETFERTSKIVFMEESKKREELIQPYLNAGHNIFLEGVGGILFPPHSLSDEVHNLEQMLELCPYADDIWFKAMAMLQGTFCRTIRKGFDLMPYFVAGSQDVGLYLINMKENLNDEQFKKTFDYYDLYKFIDDRKSDE